MTRRSTKRSTGPLAGLTDPGAPLDGAAFLDAARKVCAALGEDLLKRADGSPAVTEGLRARWEAEAKENRTADTYEVWRRRFVGQVAAAWVLSATFVRTLEDRGALGRPWIAGPGALDRQKQFFQLCPYLTERDYLLTVFRELSKLPGSQQVFDAAHNPVWRLAPSAAGAQQLLGLFRTPDAEAPAFRFGQGDTRFLGDLYQDLDDEVKSRYALLQTPRFVESFILDRTLDPAIEHFGLDGTTLIDPTCGSGHFLLGAFERLFDRRLNESPGLSQREAARLALDAVYGVDLNPYAVAIARFRLTLAFMDKAGFDKISDVPAVPMHLVVADSLLHGEVKGQRGFGDLAGQAASAWKGEEYALEDDEAAKIILNKRYAAVVGNPPYIVPKDAKLRDMYRETYVSAAGKYALAAPFTERFFQLGTSCGRVGLINANSFMKREFGKRLIEDALSKVNVDIIINTVGAYIPGHGTPTVLLFGSNEPQHGKDVLTVLANHGEPTTPEPPENGLVWRSIAEHWNDEGFENDYISVARVARTTLNKHPWSLGGGGASELKALLEEKALHRLDDLAESVGITCVTGDDDAYLLSFDAARRLRVGSTRALVTGDRIRDWTLTPEGVCLFPHGPDYEVLPAVQLVDELQYLWPFRSVVNKRRRFGVPMTKRGLTWYELQELYAKKFRSAFSIPFGEVATHNHFVLDRGGKLFKQTAPIIKLPESASEKDHHWLVAHLNSSTACFWMKQVCHFKTNHTEERPETGEPEMGYYAFSSTAIGKLPLPPQSTGELLADFGQKFEAIVKERELGSPDSVATAIMGSTNAPDARVNEAERADQHGLERMIALQEDLDWAVYGIMGLCSPEAAQPMNLAAGVSAERRLFLDPTPPESLSSTGLAVWRARLADLKSRDELKLLENKLCKRRWIGIGRGSFALEAKTFRERCAEAVWSLLLRDLEDSFAASVSALRPQDALALLRREPRKAELLLWLAGQGSTLSEVKRVMEAESVPYLAAYRFTDAALTDKRTAWERTWDLQRREDAGEAVGDIPVPPKYGREDYREGRYFNLRGKLDVPKERFISYPGCESDDDASPVYGWAGWNHREQAQALAALYQKRKTEEGWGADRLSPMLAGLLELVPWIKQWHNEPSEEFGGLRLGDYFGDFVATECRELGISEEDVRAWRPVKKGRSAAGKKVAAAVEVEGEEGKVAAKRGRKKKAVEERDG